VPSERRPRREPFSRLSYIISSYIYIKWWVFRTNIRADYGKHIEKGAGFLLCLYLLLFLGEVGLEMMGLEMARSESLVLQGVFLVLVCVALWGRFSEWRQDREEVYFAGTAEKVVGLFSLTEATKRDRAIITDLLALFRANFEAKGVVNANVAMPDEGGLRVKYVYPPEAAYDQNLVLPEGVGGAGACYVESAVVYIPSVHYRHAVIEDPGSDRPYALISDCYQPCDVQDFKSVLCAPITIYGQRYGVLNFDSKSRNMFNIRDFAQARFFAFVMAQYLHETSGASDAS
jgi:hypothetical protein